MSFLAVSQLGIEEIDWGLRVKKSCSIQAIRLKILKNGILSDGVFTLSLVCNDVVLGTVAVTAAQITEAITGTYAYGFLSFDFGEKGCQINVPEEAEYLQCEIRFAITNHTVSNDNFLALVLQHEFKFMTEYGVIPEGDVDPGTLAWYSAFAMEIYTLNNGAY